MTKRAKTTSSIIALIALAAAVVCVGEFAPRSGSQWTNLRTVLQLGIIYGLIAVSMNLCNGFTGLFSLGQAGFMTIGAYTYAILSIPLEARPGVYYLYGVADWLAKSPCPFLRRSSPLGLWRRCLRPSSAHLF